MKQFFQAFFLYCCMKSFERYKSFDDTMRKLRLQIIDSYDFAAKVCPRFNHPRQLFRWLKLRTKYVNDQHNIEQIQTMQTLFNNNIHGHPGAGDCDCFTVAMAACMAVNGWDGQNIVLVGDKPNKARHIYNSIHWKDNYYVMDLTNLYFDQERYYKYQQILPI